MTIDIKARIREVLERCRLMSLATVDEGGPWVADLIYVFDDDFNIYWMSSRNVRHSKAIETNGQAAGAITLPTGPGEMNFGIQLSGTAERIDGARYDLALKQAAKRNKPTPKETDDFLHGHSWYVLRPALIELIDEQNFGFKKQGFLP